MEPATSATGDSVSQSVPCPSRATRVRSSIERLEKSPTQELKSLSPHAAKVWDIMKPLDRVALASPQQPNPRTCLCGTMAMVLVLLFFAVAIVDKWITGEPTVSFSHSQTNPRLSAPLPGVAIAVCETDGGASVIDEAMFLKYVTPKFILRTFHDGFNRTGDARQTFMLLQQMNGTDCMPADTIGPRCIAFCGNFGVPAYKQTVETLTKNSSGKSSISSHTVHVTNNLTLQGKFGDETFSWLEIMLDLASTNLSNMGIEFWKDTNDRKRYHNVDLFLKFGRGEEWKDSNVVGEGEWSWYIYSPLPRDWDPLHRESGKPDSSPRGIHHDVELSHNTARVGALRPWGTPGTSGFLGQEERTAPTWFTWEGYSTTLDQLPYIASPTNSSHSLATLFDLKTYDHRTLFEVDMWVGLQARTFKVTRPALLEALIDLGAAYETALGFGVTVAFVAWLLCRCKLTRVILVLCNASNGNLPVNATPQSPRRDSEHSQYGLTSEPAAS